MSRVKRYVSASEDEIEYPEGYSLQWFETNPWYIEITDEKQVKPSADFIIKFLGGDFVNFTKDSHSTIKRLSIFTVEGRRCRGVIIGLGLKSSDDVRQKLPCTFDEEGNPTLDIGYIGPKRIQKPKNINKSLLDSIHKLEDDINKAEEIILKLLVTRKELISQYERNT